MIIPRTTADYIRHARRLRWEYRDRPGQMHRRLRELSRGHDDLGLSDTERATPEQAFMQLAQQYMSGRVLRHDDRQRLLAIAARQSIKPFEANLLIALAQHQGNSYSRRGVFSELAIREREDAKARRGPRRQLDIISSFAFFFASSRLRVLCPDEHGVGAPQRTSAWMLAAVAVIIQASIVGTGIWLFR